MTDTALPAMPQDGGGPASPGMPELEPLNPELTAADRCDVRACGAQAYIRVTFRTGALYFCAHHGRERHVDMLPTYTRWHDETGKLSTKRAGL